MDLEVFEALAERMKALADATRLRILKTLKTGERCVSDIAEELDGSQANISKHLKVLQHAGFVTSRKEKGRVFYHLADKAVMKVCDMMCGSLADQLRQQEERLSEFAGS